MANGRGRIAQKAYQWRADMRTGSLPHFRSWSGLKTLLFSFSPSPVLSLLNCTYFFSVLICQLTRAFRHSLNTGIQVGSFSLCRHTFIDRSLLTFCLIFLVKKGPERLFGKISIINPTYISIQVSTNFQLVWWVGRARPVWNKFRADVGGVQGNHIWGFQIRGWWSYTPACDNDPNLLLDH